MSDLAPTLMCRGAETLAFLLKIEKFLPWIDGFVLGARYLGRRYRIRSDLSTHGGPSSKDTGTGRGSGLGRQCRAAAI
jgi:hypothetical protein